MNNEIEIKLLAECQDQIDSLAVLWFNELGKQWNPDASIEKAKVVYKAHANKDTLPLTYVALSHGEAIGMASLRDNDGIRDDLTPWLGSLIVHPDYRKKKVGERLIDAIKKEAKKKCFTKLYLFTLNATIPEWYQRLGWQGIDNDTYNGHPTKVMQILLT